MVKRYSPLNKAAFTMIELIFAIVIITISMLSLPMMTQVISKGIENSFAQEAIFLASAELNQALSYKWNGNSQESFGALSKVLFAPATYTECNASTKQRPGHVHRMCLNDTTLGTANLIAGTDNISQTDYSINNAAMTDANLTTGSLGSAVGYKNAYTMDIDVNWASFGPTTGSYSVPAAEHNIKEITIIVKENGNDYVVLRTYSANIGEAEAFKRVF